MEIYCLRQVRHQINEFPFVLQGLPSVDILIIFYRCISIVSKRVHLDPYPWIFFCAHWGVLVLLPAPIWSSFALLGRFLQPAGLLERKWVLASCGHSQLLTSNFFIQPGHKNLAHRYNILPPISPTCSAFCVTSRSPGRYWKK